MSVIASRSMHIGAVIVVFFVMVILNLLASSSCTQLTRAIREKEKTLAKLEDDRSREVVNWEEMKDPERLDRALLRFGLAMRPPRHEQVVRMDSRGRPVPGQVSVARAMQRARALETAQARGVSQPRRATRSRR